MMQLYTCKVCGFTSTVRDNYTFREGVRICFDCDKDIEAGDPKVIEWFKEAKEMQCRLNAT